jgi:hypothetical protein
MEVTMFKFQAQLLFGCILSEEDEREFGVKIFHSGPLRDSPEEATADFENFPPDSSLEDTDDTHMTLEIIVAIPWSNG